MTATLTESRHTKSLQPSCSSSSTPAPVLLQRGAEDSPRLRLVTRLQSQQQPLRTQRLQQQQQQQLRSRQAAQPCVRFNSLLSAVLPAVLLITCFASLTVIHAEVEFSSNEDKRNNFEREFLSFGKRAPAAAPADLMERHFMSFGKRASDDFGRQFMPFGKRFMSLADIVAAGGGPTGGAGGAPVIGVYEPRAPLLEKRAPDVDFQRDFMAFGRR